MPPGPDMAQIQPEDPPRVLEPGGRLGTTALLAFILILLAAIATLGGLALAPQTTLSFLSLGATSAR